MCRETISFAKLESIAEVHRMDAPAGKAKAMNSPSDALLPVVPASPPTNPNYKPLKPSVVAIQDTYTTKAGEMIVRWPDDLSQEEYEDIEGWLEMIKKKIRRSVKNAVRESSN